MAVLVAVSYAITRMPKGRSTSQTRHATLDGYAPSSRQHLRNDFAREYRCPVVIDKVFFVRYIDDEFVILAAINGSVRSVISFSSIAEVLRPTISWS